MKKTQIILIIFILTFGIGCKGQVNGSGIEFYVQNIPHPILTNKNPEKCYCCIELSKNNLYTEPLINDSDIEEFNWEKQRIKLTENGMKKFVELDFSTNGVYGIPTAIVLNGKPIYSVMIFPIGSSMACDRAYVHLSNDSSEFYIHYGAGIGKNEMRYGGDPRFNLELKKYVNKKFKNN